MNVGELREALEGLDDEIVVRIASQPNWPLAFEVRSIVTPGDVVDYHENVDEDEADFESDGFAWIVTGDHPYDGSPYAPRILWDI